jgi:DMSO/TMAO reductase YedYZ heme-binding membrane subunit
VLFLWARTLRGGTVPFLDTFWPDAFQDYYHRHLFFGALGLYGMAAAVLAAVYGPRLQPKRWLLVHRANYAVFFLVWLHSFAIGSETRVGPVPLLYTAMAAVVLALVATNALRRRRTLLTTTAVPE